MTRGSPLGKKSTFSGQYDPGLLFAIPRAESRGALGLGNDLPFNGCDIWNAWELTWLGPNGVPQVVSAMIRIPAYSPNIIESKSLKLYLGSFAMTTVASTDALKEMVTTDLRACTGTDIQLQLHSSANDAAIEELPGVGIDSADARCDAYDVDASFLEVDNDIANETLHSNVLRSLCPVTNQPDMGSVLISYRGPRISHAGLLQYIVSFREHNEFHEACVERMFIDILERCEPEQLTVYARYQRRGGIDINPFRSNFESDPPNTRLWRQ